MVSKSFADTVEIIGKNRLLGEEQGRTIDARQREEEARAFQAAESMRAAQAESDLRKVKKENKALAEQLRVVQEALKDRDQALKEWMHACEAFKRLSKSYGKKQELSEDRQRQDLAEHALDAAEQDPQFANTPLTQSARKLVQR